MTFAVAVTALAIAGLSACSKPKDVLLSGTVETREIQVGSKVGGRVTAVLVEEGQTVHKGSALIRFDVAELIAQRDQLRGKVSEAEAQAARLQTGYRPEEIQQAEANTRRERASLQDLRQGPRPEEIAQARADYDAAKADAANAQSNFGRLQKLFLSGDIAAQARDDARARQDQMAGRAESARQRLRLLQAGSRPEEIRAAEQRVQAAQASEQMMRKGYRKEEIAEAQARLAQARAQLAEIEVRVAEGEVTSPAEARVEVVSVRPGDLVAPSKPVVTLLESTQLWVKVYVPEPQLGHIAVGQPASIQVDSFPNQSFNGSIEQISDQAEFLPRNIQTLDDRNHQVFGVKVRLDNNSGQLKSGMAATVKLQWKQ